MSENSEISNELSEENKEELLARKKEEMQDFWEENDSHKPETIHLQGSEEIPPWAKDFKAESFEIPDFPITLKPRLNTVYELIIKAFPPEAVKTSVGMSYIMEVYNQKMVNSIFINRSLGFSLEKIRRANNWTLDDLVGKSILLQKTEGKKDGKDTHYISCKLANF